MNEERADKHRRVLAWLEGRGLGAVVLTRRCNFSWYTGGAHNRVGDACDVGASSLVVTAEGATVVANNIEATRLAAEALPEGIDLLGFPYHDPAARGTAFARALGERRFATDAPLEGLDGAATDGEFDRLRWRLSEPEIKRYRSVCRDVAEAVESAARGLKPGVTEAAIAGRMAEALRRRDLLPWVLLVGADERIFRHRHPLPTGRRAERYAMLITCAERGGLIAAATRSVAFGRGPEHVGPRQQAVATVDAALIGATRPGKTLGDIFAVAQQAYAQVGFADEWKLHHQGGSIGYLPREVKAAPGCTVEALADQAFAWNPSITGAKCEDTILCTEAGPEVLTDTGNWPTIQARWADATFARPDVLVL